MNLFAQRLPLEEFPARPFSGDLETYLELLETALSQGQWKQLERTRNQVFERVLEGFIRYKVGEEHFYCVTGYGHDDMGREVLDQVFAHALQAESALVRPHFVSGTHALSVMLHGCLGHGDTLVCLTGPVYDTLEEVIGTRVKSRESAQPESLSGTLTSQQNKSAPQASFHPHSLRGRGVRYHETSVFNALLNEAFKPSPEQYALVQQATAVYLQRSRGYSGDRPTLTRPQLSEIIAWVRKTNPEALILVDNCYGEFVELAEPTALGADAIAGSLIKNPGAGIVPAGGYIAGKTAVIERAATMLTCPGIGREGGYLFEQTRLMLQGLYLAPGVVCDVLKGMTLAAKVFETLGYRVDPLWEATRGDIIQFIQLGSPEAMKTFCRLLQSVSPVNSHLTPIPSGIPGYADEVIMAGGTFIEGSSIELSADGPLREPYGVFLQGGITYPHTRLAIKKFLKEFTL